MHAGNKRFLLLLALSCLASWGLPLLASEQDGTVPGCCCGLSVDPWSAVKDFAGDLAFPTHSVLFPYPWVLTEHSVDDREPAPGGKRSGSWMPTPLASLLQNADDLSDLLDGMKPLRPLALSLSAERSSEDSGLASQRTYKASAETAVLWGSLATSTEVNDTRRSTWDDPLWKRSWKTDESWKVSLGRLSFFGQMGAAGDEASQQNLTMNGRTGLTWKMPMGLLGDYTIKSGPGVSCSDPLRPLLMQQRTDWLVDVQARWPLLFGVGLEFQGSAAPPLNPLAQNQVNQDLRLAVPLGSLAKLKLGAKRQLTSVVDPRPLSTTTQLYLGFELTH